MTPTLHLIGIFHTKHQQAYSHCAFTGKALRFPKMMRAQGYKVIEYSNEGSESEANEHKVMLTASEFSTFYNRNETDFYGSDAVVGSEGHQLFEAKLIQALKNNVKDQDIICHPFGHAHQQVMNEFQSNQHVETGIGYPTLMPNSFKIFESYAWMHYHQGKENRNGKNYEWVVPNYYDLDEWEPNYKVGSYLAFLGRITSLKGLDTIKAIADHSPWPIILHGQGDPAPWIHPNIEYRGPISGKNRSTFLRNARALLAPTVFTEPFCGMAVEAMLCGTPVVAVDYGAMTETVTEGVTGFRCHTLQDWLDGIRDVENLDRKTIASIARSKWSLEACGKRYDKIFKQINDLYRGGWYELREISFQKIELEEGPFARRLATWVAEKLKPVSVLDIGCGPGTYVKALRDLKIEATGIEIDPRVKDIEYVVNKSLFDVTETAQVVMCLEVAEHIEPDLGESVVQKVTSAVDSNGVLIWSAAKPNQGGIGHINCRPKEYWEELICAEGFEREIELEKNMLSFIRSGYHMGWFVQNAMIFRRSASYVTVIP